MSTKKTKIQVRDVEVGNRTLEAVLIDLAERSTRAEERSARAEEQAALALKKIDASLERMAQAEEGIRSALDHLAALTRDHLALAGRSLQMDARLDALEKKAS